MWVFSAVPERMLMIIAIIFGGYLFPYSWLYKSKVYLIFAILIPAVSHVVGIALSTKLLTLVMILFEIVFVIA